VKLAETTRSGSTSAQGSPKEMPRFFALMKIVFTLDVLYFCKVGRPRTQLCAA
jgi:hypothetical protein